MRYGECRESGRVTIWRAVREEREQMREEVEPLRHEMRCLSATARERHAEARAVMSVMRERRDMAR